MIKKFILPYRNLNKSNSDRPSNIHRRGGTAIGTNPIRSSPFNKRGARPSSAVADFGRRRPKGDRARAMRVPIWFFLMALLTLTLMGCGKYVKKTYYEYEKREAAKREEELARKVEELRAEIQYHTGYQLVLSGHYESARMVLGEVITDYPQSKLCDNAQYWIGESYFASGDYAKAKEEFQKVLTNYPGEDKVPATQLKIGLCYYEVGNFAQALVELKKVIDSYPESEEAKIAKERMDKIRGR